MIRTKIKNISALFIVLLSIQLTVSRTEAKASPNQIRVMSWNVENLFDTVDDADHDDVEFTPLGKGRWTPEILEDKLNNLATVIEAVNPDILGLIEVENEHVVDQLIGRIKAKTGLQYRAVDLKCPDVRGIRTALVSRYPLSAIKYHNISDPTGQSPEPMAKATRNILEVTATLPTSAGQKSRAITFLVNHWPSRRIEAAFGYRETAAKRMAQIAADIAKENQDRRIISMGDFNSEVEEPLFHQKGYVNSLEALTAAPAGSLLSLNFLRLQDPAHERGTYFYSTQKAWNTIDHIMIAGGQSLLRGAVSGYSYIPGSYQVVRPVPFLREGLYPRGCKTFERSRENRCEKGASDHFAVTADFRWKR